MSETCGTCNHLIFRMVEWGTCGKTWNVAGEGLHVACHRDYRACGEWELRP